MTFTEEAVLSCEKVGGGGYGGEAAWTAEAIWWYNSNCADKE